MTIDKKFFDAHPPLMTTKDDDIPDQSYPHIVGVLKVTGSDMNRIIDPEYPWRDYASNQSPPYRKKIAEIIRARNADVAHYVVKRIRYWKRIERWHYGADQQIVITKHVGYVEHKSHVEEQTDTVTQRIAADLGIDFRPGGATVPEEIPPVPPAAMAGSEGGGGGGEGSGGNLGLHFSEEFSRALHISDTDEQTFTDETTTTTTVTFTGGTTYVYWQMQEECSLERVRRDRPQYPERVYTTVAKTGWDYTDAFPSPAPGSGGNGDIQSWGLLTEM